MSRILLSLVCAGLVGFSFGCASKDKNGAGDTGVAVGDVDSDASITTKTFDEGGSDSGNIDGLSSIFFDYDKAVLTSAARATLASNAKWIRDNNVSVRIEGHCDARGSNEYNLALGERRAQSVKRYLVNLGVPEAKLTILSWGEERPVDSGDSESAYAKNRRANFVPVTQ